MPIKQSARRSGWLKRKIPEEIEPEMESDDGSYIPEDIMSEEDDAESLSLVDEEDDDESLSLVDENENVTCRGKGWSGLKLFTAHLLQESKRSGERMRGKGKHMKAAAERWKGMTVEERQPWLEKAETMQKEYWASHPKEEGTPKKRRQRISIINRCSPHKLGLLKTIVDACESKKRVVQRLGMYSLLLCSAKFQHVRFAYYVANRFDPETRSIRVDGGNPIKVDSSDVHDILGIPHGDRGIPVEVLAEESRKIDAQLQDQKLVDVYQRLEGGFTNDESFSRDFLIYILTYFLCPTGATKVSSTHYAAVSVWVECDKYNWCEHVLSFLCNEIAKWNSRRLGTKKVKKGKGKRMKKEAGGNSKHGRVGGCLHLLVLLYIEKMGVGLNPSDWCECAIGRWDDKSISTRWEAVVGSEKEAVVEEDHVHEERGPEEEPRTRLEVEISKMFRQVLESIQRQEVKINRMGEDIAVMAAQIEKLKEICSRNSNLSAGFAHGRKEDAPGMDHTLSADDISNMIRGLGGGTPAQQAAGVEGVDPMVAAAHAGLGNVVRDDLADGMNVEMGSRVPEFFEEVEPCEVDTGAGGNHEDARAEGRSVFGCGTGSLEVDGSDAVHCGGTEEQRMASEVEERNKGPDQRTADVTKDVTVENHAENSDNGSSSGGVEGDRLTDSPCSPTDGICSPSIGMTKSSTGPPGRERLKRHVRASKNVKSPYVSKAYVRKGRKKKHDMDAVFEFLSREAEVDVERRELLVDYGIEGLTASREELRQWCGPDFGVTDKIMKIGSYQVMRRSEDAPPPRTGDPNLWLNVKKKFVVPPLHYEHATTYETASMMACTTHDASLCEMIMCPVELDRKTRHWCCIVFSRIAGTCVVLDPTAKKLTPAHCGSAQLFSDLITDATLTRLRKWNPGSWKPSLLACDAVGRKEHGGWFVINMMGSFTGVRQPFYVGELAGVKKGLLHDWCMDDSNKNAPRVAQLAGIPR